MNEKQRILGIDYGHARIGLALSDPSQVIASPFSTVKGSKNPEKAAFYVLQEIQQKKLSIGLIVIGLPLLLKGTESDRAKEVRLFAQVLERETDIPIQFMDERLSSLQADRALKEADFSRKERSKYVDSVSCAIFLQSFLDVKNTKKDLL